ncbi:hypothetical protein N7532_003433 [Penicillium argentinense]|uniref:Uncharacterized protein n=1 Tax=Penicillium argentinense TaxID=1131581 RepID=A0A9W9FMI5_9EURO|nr:uncharacterized protein N7532_003433 [Penicillium argentinense]KAJ5102904.1 hypothetical protein N7532_003433 [Penicillium argentinense]
MPEGPKTRPVPGSAASVKKVTFEQPVLGDKSMVTRWLMTRKSSSPLECTLCRRSGQDLELSIHLIQVAVHPAGSRQLDHPGQGHQWKIEDPHELVDGYLPTQLQRHQGTLLLALPIGHIYKSENLAHIPCTEGIQALHRGQEVPRQALLIGHTYRNEILVYLPCTQRIQALNMSFVPRNDAAG